MLGLFPCAYSINGHTLSYFWVNTLLILFYKSHMLSYVRVNTLQIVSFRYIHLWQANLTTQIR